jgi:hypothetical protein
MFSAILGQAFFMECYHPVGEMMDMLALGNSAANFLLYCLMSTQFRATSRKILGLQQTTTTTTTTLSTELKVHIPF